MIRRRVRAWTS